MPFLTAINADPADEVFYLVYVDWLEERGDARARLLRLYTRFHFHADELSGRESADTRTALRDAVRSASAPWLCQLFGTSARLRQLRQRLED
jgi:uncharacterized protein (TIGR02996 family)